MKAWEGVFLLFSVGASLFALERAFPLRPLPEAPCRPGPVPERAELWANGVVELPICQRGRVVLRLEGTPAEGRGPWAVVAEGGKVLFQGEILGVREVVVEVEGRAPLALAFVNDLYRPPEDRNLFLRGIEVLKP